MKKFILFVVIVALMVIFVPGLRPADAADNHSVIFTIDSSTYQLDDQLKEMDAKPFIEGGRTYVPVRYMSEPFGIKVDWNKFLRLVTLTRDDTSVYLVVGVKKILVRNGEDNAVDIAKKIISEGSDLDVAPVIRAGRTYLPARWVAEAFGYQVKWDDKTRTVAIVPPGVETPEVKVMVNVQYPEYWSEEGYWNPAYVERLVSQALDYREVIADLGLSGQLFFNGRVLDVEPGKVIVHISGLHYHEGSYPRSSDKLDGKVISFDVNEEYVYTFGANEHIPGKLEKGAKVSVSVGSDKTVGVTVFKEPEVTEGPIKIPNQNPAFKRPDIEFPEVPRAMVMGFMPDSKKVVFWNYDPSLAEYTKYTVDGGPRRRWEETLPDYLTPEPVNQFDHGLVDLKVLLTAFGVSEQAIQFDKKSKTLRVYGTEGYWSPAYVEIKEGSSILKMVWEKGGHIINEDLGCKLYVKNGKYLIHNPNIILMSAFNWNGRPSFGRPPDTIYENMYTVGFHKV